MAKRNYKPEEIVSKLRQADVLLAQGTKVPDRLRTLGVTCSRRGKRVVR
jgi:putative transposase